MLVSFRQTYGSGREELFEIYSRDKRLHSLLNLCDLNLFSFHNCGQKTIDKFKKLNPVQNSEYLEFYDCSYTETIKELMKILRKHNYTHFLFTQDDIFSGDNKRIYWKELINYVKSYKEGCMISLSRNNNHIPSDLKSLAELNSFEIFKSNSIEFRKNGFFSMDDSSYICTRDMLEEIYGDEYVNLNKSVWAAENFLDRKYIEKNIPRWIIHGKRHALYTYNLFGKTIKKAEKNRIRLKDKGLL